MILRNTPGIVRDAGRLAATGKRRVWGAMRASQRRRDAGFTAVEVLIGSTLLVFGMVGVFNSLYATNRLKTTIEERALAAEAASSLAETFYGVEFGELWATYNADPSDDPRGTGTAPGARFAVEGLKPIASRKDGLQGRIEFPTLTTSGRFELREDMQDERLGMPRDLNGDGVIDTADHAGDYDVLPIRIVVEWQSARGDSTLAVNLTMVDR